MSTCIYILYKTKKLKASASESMIFPAFAGK